MHGLRSSSPWGGIATARQKTAFRGHMISAERPVRCAPERHWRSAQDAAACGAQSPCEHFATCESLRCGSVQQAGCGDRSSTACERSTHGGGGWGSTKSDAGACLASLARARGVGLAGSRPLPGEATKTASKRSVSETAVSPPDCAFAAGAHRAGHPHELFPIHLRTTAAIERQGDAYVHACSMAEARQVLSRCGVAIPLPCWES